MRGGSCANPFLHFGITQSFLEPPPQFGGAHGVGHQHGNGERTHAAGHGRVSAGQFEGFGIDIAYNRRTSLGERSLAVGVSGKVAVEFLAGGDAIDAHIDEGCAGLTISRVMKPGRPMAATRMSAWRVTAPRSRVFEWQMVTVAFWCSSNMAAGLPTMSLRPTTTACWPAMGMPLRFKISMIPAGVQGARAGRPACKRPALTG